MDAKLKQNMGLFSAVMLVISAMIGSGIFKKIAPMSAELHSSGWVLAAWLAAGAITLMGALSNAEVAGVIAKPGGQYVYFREMYGELFAFLFGWASFSVIQTSTAAAVAYIFAESLNSILDTMFHLPLPQFAPELANFTLFSIGDFSLQPFHNFGVKGCALLLVIILSIINYRGIDYGEKIGNILGSTVVIGIIFIIVIAFTMGTENGIRTQNIIDFNIPANSGDKSFMSAFFIAMMAAFWAFEGWNNVGFLAGEIKNPKRNVPRALIIGTLSVSILYLLINLSFFNIANTSFYEQVFAKNNEIAAVSSMTLIWIFGGLFISILILVSTFNSSNNSLMSAPRVYYAMANDGLFLKSASSIHQKFKTPHKAIIMQMFWCITLIISGSFDMLTEMLVFVAFIFYGCGAFGVIILRRKSKEVNTNFKVPFYPILPILFSLFSLILVVNSIIESPSKSAIGLGLVLLGLPIYFLLKKK
ncbi:MAG: amino acid permease [Bacteroidetes bacterium]|nr:amino acid permease [Bacteroidota bacterium]